MDVARLPARLRRSGRLASVICAGDRQGCSALASLRAYGAPVGSHQQSAQAIARSVRIGKLKRPLAELGATEELTCSWSQT